MPDPLEPPLVARYLRALGIPGRPPGVEALAEIVAAHVTRVPFENVSKLIRFRHLGLAGVPDATLFLEGIERDRLGGTCYANNYHLFQLLLALGYDARLCGADMREPDVHVVVMVTVERRDLLLDAGYGAPFLDPFPLDSSSDEVVSLGRERWVLRPRDSRRRSLLEHHRDGALAHGYLAKPEPRSLRDFAAPIAGSFRPEATFMRSLVVSRFERGRSTVLHNLELVESVGARSSVRRLRDLDDLVAAVEDRFGIARHLVMEAADGLAPGDLSRTWSG